MPEKPYSVRANRKKLDPFIGEILASWRARTDTAEVRESDVLRLALEKGVTTILLEERARGMAQA